jgi:hypothetical protein
LCTCYYLFFSVELYVFYIFHNSIINFGRLVFTFSVLRFQFVRSISCV